MEAKKPNIIGDYQLGDKLGHGSIGIVYKAINIKTGASVAIKQVSLPAINSDALKSIHKEIQLLSKLNHLNIVKYIDSISTDTNLNIVLEYVESGSLSNLIQKYGTLKESLAAIYIMQVNQLIRHSMDSITSTSKESYTAISKAQIYSLQKKG
jgi:serine/threonine protein kinase